MNNQGESVYYSAPDGLKLHAVDYGRGQSDAIPVVCLPGLSRNSRDFARLAQQLSSGPNTRHRVVAFDYRGRGFSEWDKDWKNYNILTEAEDVLAGMAALGIQHAAILGTSRGGMIAMALAALRPTVMRAVILNDIGPVIEGDGLTQIRAYLSRAPKPRNWEEAVAFQKATMGKAFTALGKDDWEFEARGKYREINGSLQPDHDPKLVKTLTSLDLRDRLPTLWPQFDGLRNLPVLLLRGENSSLLSAKTVAKMQGRHPEFHYFEIEGQGHAPMLHTAGIPDMIASFLGGVKD
jgi:pimeloyl-ACP methyl ester carboxylesterase